MSSTPIVQLMQGCLSENSETRLASLQESQKLISDLKHHKLSTAEISASGLLQLFFCCLEQNDIMHQANAIRCLAQMTSIPDSGNTQLVIKSGVVPLLVNLIQSPILEVAQESIWTLGNIAAENSECRDAVLKAKILDPLIQIANKCSQKGSHLHLNLWQQATCTVLNLMSHETAPSRAYAIKAAEFVNHILDICDKNIINDSCHALAYIIKNFDDITSKELMQKIVNLMGSYECAIHVLGDALRSDNDDMAQQVLDAGYLDALYPILKQKMKSVGGKDSAVHCSFWTLANIMCGTDAQRDAFFAANMMEFISDALKLSVKPSFRVSYTEEDDEKSMELSENALSLLVTGYFRSNLDAVNLKTKISPNDISSVACSYFNNENKLCNSIIREALYVVLNGIGRGTEEHIQLLLSKDIVPLVCGVLRVEQDQTVLQVALECLYRVSHFASAQDAVQKCHGLLKLEAITSDSGMTENVVQLASQLKAMYGNGSM